MTGPGSPGHPGEVPPVIRQAMAARQSAGGPPTGGPSAGKPPIAKPPFRPPMGGSLAPSGSASLRLPGEHFTASLLFLLAGSIGLVVIAPDLAGGSFLSVKVAGLTHLFTLGWLTTTIFGALYQLLPVALGAPVRSELMGHFSFWCYVPGVAVFVTSIITNSVPLHHVGIFLIIAGIILLVLNVSLTLPKSSNRDETWWAVVAGLVFLSGTLLLGVVLLHNYHTGFLRDNRVAVLATHMHVAMAGWVMVMIVGMSHRLLPMFLLAHGGVTIWTRRALLFLPAGVPVFAAGMLYDLPATAWAGAILLDLGVLSFLIQARYFALVRKRPKIDIGLRFVAVALIFLAIGAATGPVVLARGGLTHPRLAIVYIILSILGGLSLYVVGMYYKVVPFLAWIARFKGRIGREKVPTVADLYWKRVAEVQLAVMTASIVVLVVGVATGHAMVARTGALGFVLGVLLFISQIIRVMTVGSKPTPLPGRPTPPIPPTAKV